MVYSNTGNIDRLASFRKIKSEFREAICLDIGLPSFEDERAGLELSGSDDDLSDCTCMFATTRKVWFFRLVFFVKKVDIEKLN